MTPQQEAEAVEELLDEIEEMRLPIFDGFELECTGAYYWTVRMGIKIGTA